MQRYIQVRNRQEIRPCANRTSAVRGKQGIRMPKRAEAVVLVRKQGTRTASLLLQFLDTVANSNENPEARLWGCADFLKRAHDNALTA